MAETIQDHLDTFTAARDIGLAAMTMAAEVERIERSLKVLDLEPFIVPEESELIVTSSGNEDPMDIEHLVGNHDDSSAFQWVRLSPSQYDRYPVIKSREGQIGARGYSFTAGSMDYEPDTRRVWIYGTDKRTRVLYRENIDIQVTTKREPVEIAR